MANSPDRPTPKLDRKIWSWAFYDWANSAFSTTVMSGFFPIFFKQYWSAGTPSTESTAKLGAANTIACLIMVFAAPVLGAISDSAAIKKKLLAFFCGLAVLCTALLAPLDKGAWFAAALLYTIAVVGVGGSSIFYEALLPSVTNAKNIDRVSALGYAMGYLGGGVLFAINVWMYQSPATFGLADGAAAVKASFVTVSVWWALFAIPIFVAVPEPAGSGASKESPVKAGFKQLMHTFRQAPRLKTVFLFLAAYWLYIDAVGTIVKMSVDYGLSIGLESKDLIKALLITQFVGFPSAIVFGRLGQHWSPKRGILLGLLVYIGVTIFASQMRTPGQFMLMAILIGLVQGGVQSLSRSFFARLVPERQAGEFFGLFNLLGRFAAIVGPVLLSVVGYLSGSPRWGVASVSLLFLAGGLLLWNVNSEQGAKEKVEFERLPS